MRTGLIFTWLVLCIVFMDSCSSDNEVPVISITAPHDDDTIRVHTSVISADASDNSEIEYVGFYVENSLVGTDSVSPFETEWSIASYQNMEVLSINGRAYDASDNMGQSDVITVTVVTRDSVDGAYGDTVVVFDGTWAVCDITITDAPDSAVVDSITVSVTILHQEIDDVDVYLQSPINTEHKLWDNNFVPLTDTITTTSFTGEDINGTWLLRIFDEDYNTLGGFATDFHIKIYWKY
jgi:hypothetical protein